MKLYKILQLHGAPKDSVTLINTYIVANNNEEVFNYIMVELDRDSWCENNFEENEYQTYTEFKNEILKNQGDLDDDEGWEDAYYGVTKYGWEEVFNINNIEINILKKFKIINE